MLKSAFLAVSLLFASIAAFAQSPSVFRLALAGPASLGFKPPLVMPTGFVFPLFGRPLPAGKGDAVAGHKVFAAKCVGCHKPSGVAASGMIGGAMSGCWRYPKPMFHFVKLAMPYGAPRSLRDAEVYAVMAYLLWDAGVIGPTEVMNAKSLPRVTLPNRDGFVPSVCPEMSIYR